MKKFGLTLLGSEELFQGSDLGSCQEFSKERKQQERIARQESNRALQSRQAVTAAVRREELLVREQAITEAMRVVREENERRCFLFTLLLRCSPTAPLLVCHVT